VRESLEATVTMARRAEELGYTRVWYAEHHNIEAIASSATAVLIAHVAAHTEKIRLGAGGIMLPNHSPLVIAEQFGTLATLHPGRIDLGLGRAPGSDQTTMRAMRRSPDAAETFPRDVLELQGYLDDETRFPGVYATPGRGTHVPLYILGSSLFGAQLAAMLGLPYGFASHFAPQLLHDAVTLYREQFEPSEQLEEPYVIAGMNVIAADTEAKAAEQLHRTKKARVRNLFSRGGKRISDLEAEQILRSPQAVHIEQMMRCTAAGTTDVVRRFLDDFIAESDADEVMVVHPAPTLKARLRSLELLAEAAELRPTTPAPPADGR
jgi:luciferase family oxidoreductase group 1